VKLVTTERIDSLAYPSSSTTFRQIIILKNSVNGYLEAHNFSKALKIGFISFDTSKKR